MSSLSLIWVGDLDQEKHKSIKYTSFPPDCFQPKRIDMKSHKKEIRIGRVNSKVPPDFVIESCINNRMISRNHSTIERSDRGNFILWDHSLNGTYVNYKRVTGGVTLNNGDVICFGHINGANLKPGEEVSPFYSDLKYQVEIIGNGSSGKRKRLASNSPSVSKQNSDAESDNSLASSSNQSSIKKGTKKRGRVEERKSIKPKKSIVGRASVSKPKQKSSKTRENDSKPAAELFHSDEKCGSIRCKEPKDEAIDWIQCDKCCKWYHQICIGCSEEEAELDVYICPYCVKK